MSSASCQLKLTVIRSMYVECSNRLAGSMVYYATGYMLLEDSIALHFRMFSLKLFYYKVY